MKKIKGVKILGIELTFNQKVDPILYSFGYMDLANEGRDFKMNTDWAYSRDEGKGKFVIELDVYLDTYVELDALDCKWDLTKEDLLSNTLVSTLYIGEDEWKVAPEHSVLIVEVDGKLVKINLTIDPS